MGYIIVQEFFVRGFHIKLERAFKGITILVVPYLEKVEVLYIDKEEVYMGKFSGHWYKVSWKNHIGWAFILFLENRVIFRSQRFIGEYIVDYKFKKPI